MSEFLMNPKEGNSHIIELLKNIFYSQLEPNFSSISVLNKQETKIMKELLMQTHHFHGKFQGKISLISHHPKGYVKAIYLISQNLEQSNFLSTFILTSNKESIYSTSPTPTLLPLHQPRKGGKKDKKKKRTEIDWQYLLSPRKQLICKGFSSLSSKDAVRKLLSYQRKNRFWLQYSSNSVSL